MFTQALKEAILSALLRNLPSASEDALRASLTDDTLLPLCRLLEYNETIPPEKQSMQDRLIVYSRRRDLPEHLSGIRERANAAMQNYLGYRTSFRNCDPGASRIVRIGLGLHMTAEEINSALLSYNLQTISWHRVEDMLLRYAAKKNWRYAEFDAAVNAYRLYRQNSPDAQDGRDSRIDESDRMNDSAYVTKLNMALFYKLLAESDAENAVVFKKLHALYADVERSSSGAPRRTLMRMLRFLQSDFSYSVLESKNHPADQEEEDDDFLEADSPLRCVRQPRFSKCSSTRAKAAYYMMHEAAGLTPPAASDHDMLAAVNRIIAAADDLLRPKFTDPENDPDVKLKDKISAQELKAYEAKLFSVKRSALLTPKTLRDLASCRFILRCIARDLPQNVQFKAYDGCSEEERILRRMTDVGVAVQGGCSNAKAFESSCRASLFRLLLCCGSGSVRPLLHNTVMDVLRCFGFAILDATPAGTPAQQAMTAAQALGYTLPQLERLSLCLNALSEHESKVLLRGFLMPLCITERHVKDQLSAIWDIFDPRRRNSEPSRGFLMLMALYTYGYAIRGDPRAFTPQFAQRHVRGRLKEAWDASYLNAEGEDALDQAVSELIKGAFKRIDSRGPCSLPLSEQWLGALQEACTDYSASLRDRDLEFIERCIRIKRPQDLRSLPSANPLSAISIVSGGWEF